MKSPFTGGAALLKKETRALDYRKESFGVLYHFYVCEDSNEQFTTSALDTLNITQVYNKYREKYGIPFADEIREIRDNYGLSAAKMSEVLGLGTNIYRGYENGEIPSVATGRLIRLAQDPAEFKKLLEMSKNSLEQHEYDKVKVKLEHAVGGWGQVEQMWDFWLFGNRYPNILNGYKTPLLERVGNMVGFFAQHNKPYTTALNKLMFYADFGHFKKYGQSISGIYYKALQRSPVPENYGGIYNHIVNNEYAKIEETDFGDFVGERFIRSEEVILDATDGLFSESEIAMLELVSKRFLDMNTKKIVDISHEEPAWRENINDFNRISFEYAFELKNID